MGRDLRVYYFLRSLLTSRGGFFWGFPADLLQNDPFNAPVPVIARPVSVGMQKLPSGRPRRIFFQVFLPTCPDYLFTFRFNYLLTTGTKEVMRRVNAF